RISPQFDFLNWFHADPRHATVVEMFHDLNAPSDHAAPPSVPKTKLPEPSHDEKQPPLPKSEPAVLPPSDKSQEAVAKPHAAVGPKAGSEAVLPEPPRETPKK